MPGSLRPVFDVPEPEDFIAALPGFIPDFPDQLPELVYCHLHGCRPVLYPVGEGNKQISGIDVGEHLPAAALCLIHSVYLLDGFPGGLIPLYSLFPGSSIIAIMILHHINDFPAPEGSSLSLCHTLICPNFNNFNKCLRRFETAVFLDFYGDK